MCKSSRIRDWFVKSSEKKVSGLWGAMVCRKCYIDEKVTEAMDSQTEMMVNLGTGFDTRAYYLSSLSEIPVWEVDQEVNINTKRKRLVKILGEIPKNVTLVSIDFDHENLNDVLRSKGYMADKKTFFILEGVTQYLTDDGIHSTFNFLSKAPSGSYLVFTYVTKDFIEGEVLYNQEKLYKTMVMKNVWTFGFKPENLSEFLNDYGWRLVEDLSYEQLAERYVKPTGRNLETIAIERVVYAEKL
jgi:methyltransferase (TIGR00027 family)